MRARKTVFFMALFGLLAATACGGGEAGGEAADGAQAAAGGLTAEQLEKGIGPITKVDLGPIDEALVARGTEVFTLKCSACHKADERYVGPALGDVTTRRTPEFVMNMIVNPAEMIEKHPEVKKLLAEYMNPMPNQNVTQDEARAVLEYLRSLAVGPSEQTEN